MHLKQLIRTAAVVAGLSAAGPAFATPYDTLSSIAGAYNLFLLGNLGSAGSPYTTDVQGATAVAGNAYLSNVGINTNNSSGSPAGLIVGGNLSQNGGSSNGNVFVGGNATISNSGGTKNLTVGGSLTNQSGQFGGNVFVGGVAANLSSGTTISGSLSVTGANSTLNAASNGGSSPSAVYVNATTTVNEPSYWTKPTVGAGPAAPTAPIDMFGSATDIKNASTSLANQAAVAISSSGGVITITLTKNGLNVVDLSMLNGATITGINVVTAPGVTATGLIVNVAGDNLNFNGGSYNLGGLGANQVLFNFSNATTLTLGSLAFEGSLLAPLATVNFSNGHIDGSLIANNFLGNGQINYTGFTDPMPAYTTTSTSSGNSPAVAPEPASLALLASGLAVFVLLRRRLESRARL